MSAAAAPCTCGYASTGVVPSRLCFECGDRVLAQWVTQERDLLNRMPAYATAVAELMKATALTQERALRARTNEPAADAALVRRNAGKQLARLRRAHKADAAGIDLTRWDELAQLMAHDPRETMRKEAKLQRKRGLGAAALTALTVEATDILIRHVRANGRGGS